MVVNLHGHQVLAAVGSNFHVRLSGLLLSLDECLDEVSLFGSDAHTGGSACDRVGLDDTKSARR